MSKKTVERPKLGRPQIYEKRVIKPVALPEEAVNKADELRGEKPLTQFLGEIVCEKLGVNGINS